MKIGYARVSTRDQNLDMQLSALHGAGCEQISFDEMAGKDLEKKWAEVLDYAQQHATGQGSRTSFRWLEDAFNEYFQAHEEAVEKGTCASFGGQSFGQHNRDVMAEKICLELGHHVGGQHLIDEDQEERLKASLKEITESSQRSRGFRR